jgi:hypothetical protein
LKEDRSGEGEREREGYLRSDQLIYPYLNRYSFLSSNSKKEKKRKNTLSVSILPSYTLHVDNDLAAHKKIK